MDIPCTNYYNRVCIHPVGVMHHMSRLLSVEEIEELNAEVDSLLDDMDQSFLDELEAVPSPYGILSIQPIDPIPPAFH